MKAKSGNPDSPGLLEYLEDIIGTQKYNEKIQTLDQDVEKMQEQRREKGERMRFTEKEVLELSSAKNSAIAYIK